MISVIVPVYNAEKVLHYCVDSIIAQTYKDYELILVDDGSTDNSGLLCDKYAEQDKRIITVHLKNGGVSEARNKGIELSKGELICFIDSDDYVVESYLEKLINTKIRFHDCDSIWCGFQTLADYYDKITGVHLASDQEGYSFFVRSDIMTLYNKWLVQMPWNKIFSAAIIKKNKIRFPKELSIGEDLLFNLEYLNNSNGKITIINEPLINYLDNRSDSLGNKYYPNLFEIYKYVNSQLLIYLSNWRSDESQLKKYYTTCFFSYERVLRNTFHANSQIKHKYKYNRSIMKSNEFQESLKMCTVRINKVFLFAYKHRMYSIIRIVEIVLSFIRR